MGFFYDWIHRRAIPFTRHYRSAATALWVGWAGGRAALVICIARPAICIRFARRWGVGFFFFAFCRTMSIRKTRFAWRRCFFFILSTEFLCVGVPPVSELADAKNKRRRMDSGIIDIRFGWFFFLGHRVRSTSIWTPMMDGRSFPTGSLRFNETNGVSSNGSGSRRSDRVGLAYWVSTGFLLSFFFLSYQMIASR